MTYSKKSFYSKPKLTSIDNVFQDINSCCLSQVDSELINNKLYVSQKHFNVDSLYQTQIMKKMSGFRYELKFVLNESQLSHLLVLIKQYGFKKHFPKRTVNSIYFEDYNFSSIKDNLSGISKRKKVRLRWYKKNENSSVL